MSEMSEYGVCIKPDLDAWSGDYWGGEMALIDCKDEKKIQM